MVAKEIIVNQQIKLNAGTKHKNLFKIRILALLF